MKSGKEIIWTGRDGSRRKLVWDSETGKWRAYKSPVAVWLQKNLDDEDFMILAKIFGDKPRRELRACPPEDV